MTTLLTIAEVLAGEALVSPGGPVDTATVAGEDGLLWALPHHAEAGRRLPEPEVSVRV